MNAAETSARALALQVAAQQSADPEIVLKAAEVYMVFLLGALEPTEPIEQPDTEEPGWTRR